MITLAVRLGRDDCRASKPVTLEKVMVPPPPAFESRTACRSEPDPESLLFRTMYAPAQVVEPAPKMAVTNNSAEDKTARDLCPDAGICLQAASKLLARPGR